MTFYFPSRTEDLTLNVRDQDPPPTLPPPPHTSVIGFRQCFLQIQILLVEGALFNLGILRFNVSVNMSGSGEVGLVWLRGRDGELPAGGICASQGTFSSFFVFVQNIDSWYT